MAVINTWIPATDPLEHWSISGLASLLGGVLNGEIPSSVVVVVGSRLIDIFRGSICEFSWLSLGLSARLTGGGIDKIFFVPDIGAMAVESDLEAETFSTKVRTPSSAGLEERLGERAGRTGGRSGDLEVRLLGVPSAFEVTSDELAVLLGDVGD